MKKYGGLLLLGALAGSVLFTFKASAGDAGTRAGQAGIGAAGLSVLEQRLASRMDEQKELLAIAQRLLGVEFQQGERAVPALSGTLKPQLPPPQPAAVATTAKPAAPPWWSGYRVSMAYLSGGDSYAVINGKLAAPGQALQGTVQVERIEQDAVVLRNGGETHAFSLAQ